jgi:hypothetical protein
MTCCALSASMEVCFHPSPPLSAPVLTHRCTSDVERGNEIVLCSKCDVAVHQACTAPFVLRSELCVQTSELWCALCDVTSGFRLRYKAHSERRLVVWAVRARSESEARVVRALPVPRRSDETDERRAVGARGLRPACAGLGLRRRGL